jgi:hypothetical protein
MYHQKMTLELIEQLSTPIVAVLNLVGYWLLYKYQKTKIRKWHEHPKGTFENPGRVYQGI